MEKFLEIIVDLLCVTIERCTISISDGMMIEKRIHESLMEGRK